MKEKATNKIEGRVELQNIFYLTQELLVIGRFI